MKDLTVVPGSPDADCAPVGGTIRINRSEDLRSGQYWRAKDEVPATTKPERRRRDVYLPADHPDYRPDGWIENRIGSEDYFVDVPLRSALPAGRIHLVRSLKLVDGDIHTVVVQGHPSEAENSDRHYLVDEFLHYFELVSEEEAQAVRAAEIADLHSEIADLQQAMIAGPPTEPIAGLLGHQEKLPAKPSVGTMIANIGHIESLQASAERAVAMAERHSGWITSHTKQIGIKTSALVPFFQERASAALAATESVMRYARDLTRGVQSLGLYTGRNVDVRRLSEGSSADPSEPLVIHRDMLFMDEEYVINLQYSGEAAGADHEDFDDFVDALKTDRTLLERIFPYPRMIVLMRYRRDDRMYFSGGGIEAALANAAYNEPNRAQFLLVRDGDNLFQVWSELTTQKIEALYPAKRDGDQAFRGVDGSLIGPNDIDLSDAKERLHDLNRVYKNLLILLWGLNDREAMFGPFYEPSEWTPDGFLDEGFQQRRFRFWDPYGERQVIGTGRPDFTTWLKSANGWLRSGSRVLVMRDALRHHKGLNGSEMTHRQDKAVRSIGERALEYVVRSGKKGHVVPVTASRMVHPRERLRPSYLLKQTFDIPLDETDGGYGQAGSLEWLCLDMIEAADVDHYLQSRHDRRRYMRFYSILLQARNLLAIEDADMAPVIAKLEAAYASAPVPLKDGMTPRNMARHAVRLWRAANRGASVPREGQVGHEAAYKTLLGSMWTLAGNDHPVEAALSLAKAQGREPLRLVMTGRDRFALYATSVGDEIEDRLYDHVWVTRISCVRKAGVLKPGATRIMLMPDAVADEEILHEWERIADWKGKVIPEDMTRDLHYDEPRKVLDHSAIRKSMAAVQQGDLSAFLTKPSDLARALADLNLKRTKLTGRSGQVADMSYVQPFAVIRQTRFRSRSVEGFTARYEQMPVTSDYAVLSLQDNPYRMLHRLCETDAEREMVIKAFVSHYERKDVQRDEFLRGVAKTPDVGPSPLVDWVSDGGDPVGRRRSWNSIPLDANWAETLRKFDMRRLPHTRDDKPSSFWAPDLAAMTVWMADAAPAELNAICRHFQIPADVLKYGAY